MSDERDVPYVQVAAEQMAREDVLEAEIERLRDDAHHLREALREAIGWSYGGGLTPERRDALERIADA